MKIGLFFGSFNPPHAGHLIIAGYMANYTGLDKVWMVVSPQNPLKTRENLANIYDRLEMVKLATENSTNVAASDIELKLLQPSYTIDTLTYLAEKYPDHRFALIMGADNLLSLPKWKNYEQILNNYEIYIYPRPDCDLSAWEQHPKVIFTDAPVIEMSSTFIRSSLKKGRSIEFFVPDKVLEFIKSKHLYY